MVSEATTKLCPYSMNAAIDYINEQTCLFSIKLYLQKQARNQI
jgi:hypothetical protein